MILTANLKNSNMKKQHPNNSNHSNVVRTNAVKENIKPAAQLYTEADLGEDILNISLCSVYSAVRKLMNNIYSRTYAFQ